MLERLRERFSADPGDLRSFSALEEQWFVAGSWDDLIWLYQRRLEAPGLAKDPKQRAGLLFKLGQIQAERRRDSDAAARSFRMALRFRLERAARKSSKLRYSRLNQ